ncbi:MAG TPA: argininosuccinate synthase [Vicinamibacterales bacterium]|nr:argininosuccinate synthase [Vicinamibacterales bacterium]
MERIVLAYSGGLESTAAITWLTDELRTEVVAVTLDLGQGSSLDGIRERALAAGAIRAHVIDARDEFASAYLMRALAADALRDGVDPMTVAISRPIIARHLVELARIESATAVAHGASPRSADGVRLDVAIRACDPDARIVSPAQMMGKSRDEVIAFAKARGIPVPPFAECQTRLDRNLWGRSLSGGLLDDPWAPPTDDAFTLTRSSRETSNQPAEVELAFVRGIPQSINGVVMSPVELIQSLETIAGEHGVGRLDVIEHDLTGGSARVIRECPAAAVLHLAHRELRRLVVPADLSRLTGDLAAHYAGLIDRGEWLSPTRDAIDAFVGRVQERVSGDVRLRLYKGDIQVTGRRSPHALHAGLSIDDDDDRPPYGGLDLARAISRPLEQAVRASAAAKERERQSK